jgi:hypothetical protein
MFEQVSKPVTRQNGQLRIGTTAIKMFSATNNGLVSQGNLRPNQSLKLTAEAGVVSRCAQENGFVVAARRQCWTALRIVRKYSYQRRSLAPVR